MAQAAVINHKLADYPKGGVALRGRGLATEVMANVAERRSAKLS